MWPQSARGETGISLSQSGENHDKLWNKSLSVRGKPEISHGQSGENHDKSWNMSWSVRGKLCHGQLGEN